MVSLDFTHVSHEAIDDAIARPLYRQIAQEREIPIRSRGRPSVIEIPVSDNRTREQAETSTAPAKEELADAVEEQHGEEETRSPGLPLVAKAPAEKIKSSTASKAAPSFVTTPEAVHAQLTEKGNATTTGELKAETETIKVDAQKLMVEDDKLKIENDKLKIENGKLKIENEKLKSENEKLRTETEKLKCDLGKPENENPNSETRKSKGDAEERKAKSENLTDEGESNRDDDLLQDYRRAKLKSMIKKFCRLNNIPSFSAWCSLGGSVDQVLEYFRDNEFESL